MENSNLYVVTGGPGSGKTTLLTALERRGLTVAPEDARVIIQEQVAAGGSALPWADRAAFTRRMLRRSVRTYHRYADAQSPMLLDRGLPDTLGYARLIGLAHTALIEAACRAYRYAPLVFIAPPWEEIYRTDSERKQDFAEAVRTFETLSAVYRDCGYRLVEVPRAEPEARAEFVRALLPAGGV